VHDSGVLDGEGGCVGEVAVEEPARDRWPEVAQCSVDREAGGLVDGDEVIVLVEDIQGEVGARVGMRGFGDGYDEFVTGCDDKGLPRDFAVPGDVTFGDEALEARAAEVGAGSREDRVEPAGGFGD